MFERYKELENEVKSKKKEITDLESELRNLNKSTKESEKDRDAYETEVTELEAAIVRYDQKLQYLDSTTEKQNKSIKEKKDAYDHNHRQLRALEKGDKVIEEDSILNLNNQLKEAEVNLANTISEIKQQELKKKHLTQELEQNKQNLETFNTSTKQYQKEIEDLTIEIEVSKKKLDSTFSLYHIISIEFDVTNEEYQDFIEEKRQAISAMNDLNQQLNEMSVNNPAFRLNVYLYSFPYL